MRLVDRLEPILIPLIDRLFARLPRPRPDPARLRGCRVVAHRGAHGPGRPENTLPAFDAALACGAWGIEFDLRWTRDGVPVVVHDPDLARVFGLDVAVGRTAAAELQRLCPQVPTLAEVLARYGGRAHLMVELKAEPLPEPGRRNRILGELFAGLAPVRDYHLLSLSPEMLEPGDLRPGGGLRCGGRPEPARIQPGGPAPGLGRGRRPLRAHGQPPGRPPPPGGAGGGDGLHPVGERALPRGRPRGGLDLQQPRGGAAAPDSGRGGSLTK